MLVLAGEVRTGPSSCGRWVVRRLGSERVIPPVLRLHGYWCDERRDGMATNLQCRDALAGERRWKLGTCFFGTTRPSQLQGWHGRITAPIRSPAIGCPTPRPACNTSSWVERDGLYQHRGARGTGSPAWVLVAAVAAVALDAIHSACSVAPHPADPWLYAIVITTSGCIPSALVLGLDTTYCGHLPLYHHRLLP